MSQSAKIYERLIEKLVAWVNTRSDIRAAVVIGSKARADESEDDWSDLDIMLMAKNPDTYLTTADWLENIGEPWLTCEYAAPTGQQRALTARFEGDTQIDFIIVPSRGIRLAALLMRLLIRFPRTKTLLPTTLSAQMDAFSDTLSQGVQVLLDKDGVWRHLPGLPVRRPLPSQPTEREFINVVSSFWHWSTWNAKLLRRGELWRPIYHCSHDMKEMLLRMLEWHALAVHGRDYRTWYDGRYLERWADPDAIAELRDTFAHYDEEDARRALIATMNLFRRIAVETAQQLNYPYVASSDERATALVMKLLGREHDNELLPDEQ